MEYHRRKYVLQGIKANKIEEAWVETDYKIFIGKK